jgi:hypothetical protein
VCGLNGVGSAAAEWCGVDGAGLGVSGAGAATWWLSGVQWGRCG